ncbi:hypothetical protein ENUP19_0202G0005 [Entamoeba nuttalli]|uniref:Uncharacterized protein n=2 Tax=Entamoeba nuttalli TaxID=412467 RepID=K2HRJ0_ENTNP|nr:hypothetical protein ENU1_160730 [Entamoeba nuttalli P19]EKE38615.1 hypothetical protein ENU1_160730 [Entamoeba nuttalli P19]|eukprot:XP_008859052.1 hypothetical protein ENU1_160730 [Entamoeba nuttalli P19]
MDVEGIIFDQCTLSLDESDLKIKKIIRLNTEDRSLVKCLKLINTGLVGLNKFKISICPKILQHFKEAYKSLLLLPETSFSTQQIITTTLLIRINELKIIYKVVAQLKRGEIPIAFIDKIDQEIIRLQELNTEILQFHIKQVLSELILIRSAITIAKAVSIFDINLLHSTMKDVDTTRMNIISTITEIFSGDPIKVKQMLNTFYSFEWNNFINKCLDLCIRRGDILLGPPNLQLFKSLELFESFRLRWKGNFIILHSISSLININNTLKCFIDNSYGNPSHPISLIYPESFIDEYEYWIPSILATMVSALDFSSYLVEEERKELRSFIIVKCDNVYFVWCGHFITQQIDVIAAQFDEMIKQLYYLSDL